MEPHLPHFPSVYKTLGLTPITAPSSVYIVLIKEHWAKFPWALYWLPWSWEAGSAEA